MSKVVEEEGFQVACSTDEGATSLRTPDYALRRVEVRGTDSLLRFALSVWSGNRWLLPWGRDSSA